jgi:hypothetical protein
VTVSKNNEKEEKQEANLMQNSAIHILAATVGESEKKDDMEMDMEIDDDNANTRFLLAIFFTIILNSLSM